MTELPREEKLSSHVENIKNVFLTCNIPSAFHCYRLIFKVTKAKVSSYNWKNSHFLKSGVDSVKHSFIYCINYTARIYTDNKILKHMRYLREFLRFTVLHN